MFVPLIKIGNIEASKLFIRTWLIILVLLYNSAEVVFAQPDSTTCRQNATEVQTDGGTLRLRDYLCSTQNGARVRVQLHRINDALAHAALTKTLPDALTQVMGKADVIPNGVSASFSDLMARFGEEREFPCRQFRQFAPGQNEVMTGTKHCFDGRHQRRTLGGWRENSIIDAFPAAADLASLIRRNVVPPTYEKLSDTKAWRYMTAADLEDISDNVRKTNELVWAAGLPRSIEVIQYPKEFALYRHVAAGQLPKGFAILEAELLRDGCGDANGWVLNYTPRPMMIELALIESLSSEPVTISDFSGVKSRTSKLRKRRSLGQIKSGSPMPLDGGQFTLEPRGRAILFQRMSFVVDQQPDYVKLAVFDYGPAEFLHSFDVNGFTVSLTDRSHNATLLSMSTETGSCPFLYVHKNGQWVNRGKMLHEANGAALKQWDDKEFEGFRGRFRLTELEPELAIIDRAVLDVTLKDGKTLSLQPDRPALADADSRAEHIYMHEVIELSFGLPDGVEEVDVERTKLRVLGHYERYSALLQTASLKPSAPAPRMCFRTVSVHSPEDTIRRLVLAD